MTTLTRWLLRAFADHWPGGLPGSGDAGGPLVLEDRDNSTVVDVDTSTDPTTLTPRTPSQSFDLTVANVLGVALTDYSDTPAGLGGNEYRSEPVLSVRIEGADERQHGYIADADEFENDLARVAIDLVETRITNGTLAAAPVDGFYVAEPDNHAPDMSGWKDSYQWQFEVQPVGYRQV